MPASYTHYCFGREVLSLLPEGLREEIAGARSMFDMGLHGPDVFFYCEPLRKNAVSRLGYAMHKESGRAVFRRMAALLAQEPTAEARAYVLGFLCHFVLDSRCHGFVNSMDAMGVSHTLLETQLDRSYLVEDGHDPLTRHPAAHIRPDAVHGRMLARFFPQATAAQGEKALRGMVQYLQLLLPTNPVKRKVVSAGIDLLGKHRSFGGMMMPEAESRACRTMVERLRALYQEALPIAAALLTAFPDLSHSQYDADFDGTEAARLNGKP